MESALSTDNSTAASVPELEVVDDAMAAVLRTKSPAERLAISNSMWRFARDMIRANIVAAHPEWSASEVDRATARRLSHGAV
jgi:hypothetical protein